MDNTEAGTQAPESQTYGAMLTELEGLVQTVANPDIDLDQLVAHVETGYTLIRKMRSRLNDTRQRVETLRESFAELEDTDASDREP